MRKPYLTTKYGILYSDDCLDILPEIHSETIDCVFADPPFNLDKDYGNGYDDNKPEDEYFDWCEKWITECCRVLKPGGAIFVYGTPEIAIKFGNILNRLANFRHWIALSMKGTYQRGKKLYPAHYSLLYYTKNNPSTFNKLRTPILKCRHCNGDIKDYGGHRSKLNPKGLNLTDFWEDTSPNRHKKYKVRKGVNELKLMIPERAILMSTNEGEIVLDPFGGGGSTYQAAEKNKRKWIGIELNDCEYVKKRLGEEYPKSLHNEPPEDLRKIFIENEDS